MFWQEHNGGEHGAGEGLDALHHIQDSHTLELPFIGEIHLPQFHLMGIDMSITKHVVMLWVAALIMVIVFVSVARIARRQGSVPSGVRNFFEVFVEFIRDEIVYNTLGRGGERFIPYFLTLFFFVLFCNLLGLVPYGATATGNITVTGTLALFTFSLMQILGIASHGPVRYLKNFVPPGVPIYIAPLILPLEMIGQLVKAFALTIRLFANMIAGHIVILSLIGLIFIFKSFFVAPISIALAIGINLLEIFVAFLQAYIFTFLSALFIAEVVHGHGHEEAEHE